MDVLLAATQPRIGIKCVRAGSEVNGPGRTPPPTVPCGCLRMLRGSLGLPSMDNQGMLARGAHALVPLVLWSYGIVCHVLNMTTRTTGAPGSCEAD